MPSSRSARLRTAGVAVAVIVVDQLTKLWAVRRLPRGPIHVTWTLDLDLAHNTGAAFSLLQGRGMGPAIALAGLIILAGLAMSSSMFTSRLASVALGLVMGGATGNLADRLFRSHSGFLHGAVVDFVDLGWWPVFNVADACVVVGVIVIAVITAFGVPATNSDDADQVGDGG